ncbi:MAG: Na/Pi cotransporter family protein [Desulfatiglans sp.]|jgi:phosphate:Na+ symporter|nr:Na/Pi cotransporter family protein [Thermodesulfobacteriota bacterium]MEE4352680.1 Na/Pi cotransporter family protein [Desulfatiglans sp.]
MTLIHFLSFISGIFIFVYGMLKGSRRLENLASFRLRNYLNSASNSRPRSILAGFLFGLVTQSSSTTSVIVITLVSSALISLPAALTMILGGGVGATLTVQIIAFNIYEWAIIICGLGIIIRLFSRSDRGRNVGEAVFYFALIFLGMKIMSESISPLKDNPIAAMMIRKLIDVPLSALVFATIFTAIIQTSSATLGIVISLLAGGIIDLESALALALGANIGTCATAILSALGADITSRRVAYGFVFIKIMGAAVIYPLVPIIADWLPALADSQARQVAHFHTLFNLFVLFFFPATGLVSLFLEKIVPVRDSDHHEFVPKYLDPKALMSPSLALANAHREVMRMADIVELMLVESIKGLESTDLEAVKRVENLEGHVDILNREIKLYLTQLSLANASPEESRREMSLITFTVNLEHIADIIESNIMTKARKRQLMGAKFSKEGWQDIVNYHKLVLENFKTALAAFVENNYALARQVMTHKQKAIEMEWELRQSHIDRLHKGLAESIDTSSLHMDILRDLQMVNSFISNIIYPIIEAGDPRIKGNRE